MKRIGIVGLLLASAIVALVAAGQGTGVEAEAINQANVRARPDINAEQVAEITSGTRYAALGRNEFISWVLLGDRETLQPVGWVFGDLLTFYGGDIRQLPLSTVEVGVSPTNTPQPTPVSETPAANDPAETGATAVQVTPFAGTPQAPDVTATTQPPASGVTGLVQGEINLRYGPGTQYTVLRRAFPGEMLEITATHSQLPWVQFRLAESPTGFGWVAENLLDYTGNLATLPVITQMTFALPELTPTPARREVVSVPGGEAVSVSPAFAALGDRIWNTFLDANFVPEGGRFASLYIQDLQTGEAIAYNNEVAYSGTSVNKVALLAEYYASINGYPTNQEGEDIAKTMICSQNTTSNDLLSVIGGEGVASQEYLRGAELTTIFLRRLGFEDTFLTAPYDARPNSEVQPTAPPRAIELPITAADQSRANPNPSNQLTVDEIGTLLSAMYQCAYNETGPLIDEFGGAFTPQECRHMLHVMSNNTVDAFIKAGVPADVRVAHKHGWIADTHTNAGIVFTPGGDYVMAVAFYQPETILFSETLPLAANASRAVYNYLNPTAQLDQPREGFIPEAADCPYGPNHPLVMQITNPDFLAVNDPSLYYTGDEATPEPLPSTPTPTATVSP
jgi:beta-lactamase class A